MKAGDLVRIVNEWVAHNPWMKEMKELFEDEAIQVGLITAVTPNQNVAAVLIGGRTEYIEVKLLEVINESR